jgi:RNA recognition motif-containing protein
MSIYVAGIPYECTEEGIKELMSTVGVVTRIKMPTWHDSGKIKGYAIVDFDTKEAALSAIKKFDNHKIYGRYLKIALSSGEKEQVATKKVSMDEVTCGTIFVGNLSYEAKEDELLALFEKYGPIKEVRIVSENGRSKGFGYIDFKFIDSAKKLFQAGDVFKLNGRVLKIDVNSGTKKAGFKYRKEAYEAVKGKPEKIQREEKMKVRKEIRK